MRPQRHNNNKPNYSNDPYKSYFSNRKQKDPNYIELPQPYETWFSKFKQQGLPLEFIDEFRMYPSHIIAFNIVKKQKVFIVDAFTKNGISKNDVVSKESVNFMYWIDAVYAFPHITTKLIKIGWYSKEERNKYELPRKYRPRYKVRDILIHIPIKFCVCGRPEGKCTGECVKGREFCKVQILDLTPHSAVGQTSFEYSFRTWIREIGGASCSEDQLFREVPEIISYPGFIDITISTMRKGIACGKDIDDIEFVIPREEWPTDCRKDSGFYAKPEQYKLCKSAIDELNGNNNVISIISMNKIMTQQILYRLFTNKLSTLKNDTIYPINIITKATKQDMDFFGAHIPELLIDYGLKQICIENEIDLMFSLTDIKFDTPIESLKAFGVSPVLRKYNDSILQISSPIVSWRYIRAGSIIMLHRFSFQTIKSNTKKRRN